MVLHHWIIVTLLIASSLTVVDGRVNNRDEPLVSSKKIATGAVVGSLQNAANFAVKTITEPSNVVSVFSCTKTSCSKLFASVNTGIGPKVSPHISFNEAKIPISKLAAHTAGVTGHALKTVQKIAPIAFAATVAYDIVDVYDDVSKGNARAVIRKIETKALTYTAGSYGAAIGGIWGTTVFPGVGTLVGGLVGGVVGGVVGGIGGDVVAELLWLND